MRLWSQNFSNWESQTELFFLIPLLSSRIIVETTITIRFLSTRIHLISSSCCSTRTRHICCLSEGSESKCYHRFHQKLITLVFEHVVILVSFSTQTSKSPWQCPFVEFNLLLSSLEKKPVAHFDLFSFCCRSPLFSTLAASFRAVKLHKLLVFLLAWPAESLESTAQTKVIFAFYSPQKGRKKNRFIIGSSLCIDTKRYCLSAKHQVWMLFLSALGFRF